MAAPGGATPIQVDLRLVVATPFSLEEKIRRGEFREDLFYRLQGLALTLPRFHERQDKRALLRHVFAQEAADTLALNDIGRVSIKTAQPLAFEPYRSNRTAGSFIVIDEATNNTVAAGLIE